MHLFSAKRGIKAVEFLIITIAILVLGALFLLVLWRLRHAAQP